MADVYEIADRYVETLAEMNPVAATFIGIAGHDHLMSDYSPDAAEAMAAAQRNALAEMRAAEPQTERERICRDTFIEEVSLSIEEHDARERLRNLNIMHSPVQALRMVFDMMPMATEEQWSAVASRLEKLGDALTGYRASLTLGADSGLVSSKRQTFGTIAQIDTWTGATGSKPFTSGFLARFDESKHGGAALRARMEKASDKANAALRDFASFLRNEYLASATERDGVGRDRYMLASRGYNGIALDLEETYRWGWEQAKWVRSEMEKTAWRIKPGGTVGEAVELLDTDPARAITGVDEFRQWMQDLQDRTIADFDGRHFDLDPRVRVIEAMVAPPGGQLAMYYTGPSEDFSRPGRTWYPTGGKAVFPVWREVSVAYHEGVPGHHFQIATTKTLAGELSRYQRLLAGTSGYIEGWALYAERLMGELGYLENPDYYMGMLDSQALRSVRVVVDIGMHLGLKVPDDSDFHPGEVWTPELALQFMRDSVHFPPDFVASEIDRYLGIPGQAISYKVGEKVWLEAREAAKRRGGADFDLKSWHNAALHLGPMGLAQMKREMATEG
jgi:uncharacterized protein (DUF885 family)